MHANLQQQTYIKDEKKKKKKTVKFPYHRPFKYMHIPIFHFSFPSSFKVLTGIISFLGLEEVQFILLPVLWKQSHTHDS